MHKGKGFQEIFSNTNNSSQYKSFVSTQLNVANSAGPKDYIDCISAERYESPDQFPGYDIKQSDDEAPLLAL